MSNSPRDIPVVLKALGRRAFPQSLSLPGGEYERVRVFKHDFFAATGLFRRGDGHLVVLKIGRTADVFGLPGRWIGRYLAAREARIYRLLADVEHVPAYLGKWGACGFIHEYVAGRALHKHDQVGDAFFDELQTLMAVIHRRGMAYVDLEKCENIIVGEDGKPHLIDFQISWYPHSRWGRWFPPWVWLGKVLQRMDEYHLLKHRRRTRPDQLGTEPPADAHLVPAYIKIHRAITRPLQRIRRGVLRRVDPDYAAKRR